MARTATGTVVLDRRVANDQAARKAVFADAGRWGPVQVCVDQPGSIGAVAVAPAHGLPVSYLPGCRMRQVANTFAGQTKTDAPIISEAARSMPHTIRPLVPLDPVIAEMRLVTLTGPGGVGKPRLALEITREIASHFTDGVTFIDLTPVATPELVAPTIAHARGMREAGDRPIEDRLVDALRDRHLLLLIDNFEPVVAAAPLVSHVLAGCPLIRVFATSREALRLSAEWVIAVAPLTLPAPDRLPDDPVASEAVRLFIERARAVRADFALTNANGPCVIEIVRRVDGLPLAIELAAARLAHLPPATLLQRLDHRLPLLTGGARDLPKRQQTLRSAIAWSYDLLWPQEQCSFRRLAVFTGGCTLEAAEAVAAPDGDSGFEVLDILPMTVDLERAAGHRPP